MHARIKVGQDTHGYTYWYDRNDRYIYQRNQTGQEWTGWLCSGSVWDYFRRNMPASISVEEAIEGKELP